MLAISLYKADEFKVVEPLAAAVVSGLWNQLCCFSQYHFSLIDVVTYKTCRDKNSAVLQILEVDLQKFV